MKDNPLSLDEHVETLKRSKLPTLVTEGRDEYTCFRRLEESLIGIGVSVYPVGGRDFVLRIFERRKELGRNDVCFLADRDIWVYEDVPEEYVHRKILFTEGYAIENDLYRDGELELLLVSGERRAFCSELKKLIELHSYCVSRLLNGLPSSISDHPNRVLDETGSICKDVIAITGYTGPHPELFERIMAEYDRLLRRKTLLQLLIRQLSYPTRPVKFGRNQLIEIAAARRGPNFRRVESAVSSFFSSGI